MKKIMILILLIPAFGYSQTTLSIPIVGNHIIYKDTIITSGLSKKQLYTNAKKWIVDNVRNYRTSIQSEDMQFDHLLGDGILKVSTSTMGIPRNLKDRFTISFDFKDGKFRYSIYDFYIREIGSLYGEKNLDDLYGKLNGTASSGYSKGQCKDLVSNNDREVKAMIASFVQAISAKDDF